MIEVAQYEVSAASLSEAGEQFKTVAVRIDEICEQLERILYEWPESLPELCRELAGEVKNIYDTAKIAGKMGNALLEIAEIYAHAESSAFAGNDGQTKRKAISQVYIKSCQSSASVSFTYDLIMPEWLQLAVLRFEQSQTDPTGGVEIR